MARSGRTSDRKPAILIFAEHRHDQDTLDELARGLRKDLPRAQKPKRPMVLMRGREAALKRKNAQSLLAQVERFQRLWDVKLVIAHEDCDAVEPAHEDRIQDLTHQLSGHGFPVVPAAPAWEMETWLYLWPDAALKVNSRWRRPSRTGKRVGLIPNAKEQLRRDLRPSDAAARGVRDYDESDCARIAGHVRESGKIDRIDAQSASYERFRDALRAAKL